MLEKLMKLLTDANDERLINILYLSATLYIERKSRK